MFDTSITTKYQHIQGFKEREREKVAAELYKIESKFAKESLKT